MRNKQGISLIVLVITIIVMVILAAAVVITLSNTGIINKSSKAVDLTNEAAVQDLAALIWADAFMDNKRGEALVTEVTTKLGEQGITADKWNIAVADTGVTISKKGSGSTQTPIKELTALVPGEFVNYTAGNWTQTEIDSMGSLYSGEALPTSSNKFGGFKAEDSKDASITPYSTYANTYASGWRVLSVEDGVVKIIHAGTPEGYYQPAATNGAYRSEYILNKDTTNTNITESIKSGVTVTRSWTMYENSLAVANSAHAMTYAEANALESTNDLRITGSYYWLASARNDSSLYDVDGNGNIISNLYVCYGVRPVVTLKSEVQVVGGQGTSAEPYQLVIQ